MGFGVPKLDSCLAQGTPWGWLRERIFECSVLLPQLVIWFIYRTSSPCRTSIITQAIACSAVQCLGPGPPSHVEGELCHSYFVSIVLSINSSPIHSAFMFKNHHVEVRAPSAPNFLYFVFLIFVSNRLFIGESVFLGPLVRGIPL